MNDDRLAVGLVRGVHGLRGAVRVEILSDNASRFEDGSVLYLEGSDQPLTVASAQRDGPGLLVNFREIKDRPTADTLREKYLEAPIDRASLPADTWYWHEIVGCAVSTESGIQLGTVREVFRVGEAEVYVVVGDRGETLVPAVSAVVTKLDPPNRQIIVNGAGLGIGE